MSRRRTATAWLFMAPALLLLAIFTFYPIVYGIYLAFCSFDMLRTNPDGSLAAPVFTGIANFHRLLHDPYFFIALKNSALYLIVVPFIQFAAIGVAMLVNQELPGIKFFRAAFYVPVVTSIVVVGFAWDWVFKQDGLLNWMLRSLHVISAPVPWLTDTRYALWSIMFVTLWQGLGYYMLLYLAGLQTISPEFEEAARLDGAGPLQVFWRITLPLLMPTVAMCTIISCISAVRVFGEIWVMTKGGPENSTLTLGWYIYTKGFTEFDMGYAAALALVMAAFVGLVSLMNVAFFKEGGLKYW
ncbi:MAG: carbohydrate ABC transporter permease [Candidatus Xenobia bacterium]